MGAYEDYLDQELAKESGSKAKPQIKSSGSYEDYVAAEMAKAQAQAPVQGSVSAVPPVPVTLGASPPPPVPQMSGIMREPALIGSEALKGAASLGDIAHDPYDDVVQNLWANILGTPAAQPQVTGTDNIAALTKMGLVNRPDLQPQGLGERLMGEAASGAGAGGPFAMAAGPAGIVPSLVGSATGSIAAGEGAKPLSDATGVPSGATGLLLGLLGGTAGAGVTNAVGRAIPALADGVRPAIGALMPGAPSSQAANLGITPELQTLRQQASDLGVDIPAQYLVAGDPQTMKQLAATVPPEVLRNTLGQLTRRVSNSIGLDQPTLSEVDLTHAENAVIGPKFQQVIGNNPQDLSTAAPQAWGDLVNNLHGVRTAVDQTGALSEVSSKLRPILNDIDNVLSEPADLTAQKFQNLTNWKSPIARAQASADPDIRAYAGQIRDHLENAFGELVPPEDQALWQEAKGQWRAVKAISDPVVNGVSGTPNFDKLASSVSTAYGGFAPAGDLGTVVKAGKVLPQLTETGGTPSLPSPGLGAIASHSAVGSGAGALLGEALPHMLAGAVDNPLLYAGGGLAAGASYAGLKALGSGLHRVQGAYLASPSGTQRLLDILNGRGQLGALTLGLPSGIAGAAEGQSKQP